MNKNSFYECDKLAKKASEEIEKFLKYYDWTVFNVEDDLLFRELDIDLIAQTEEKQTVKIEIKADKYYNTNNYFCEVISNTTKNNLGCFYQTKSDYIYYYFIEEKELHIIPTIEAQEYLKANEYKFKDVYPKTTSTHGQLFYKNKGLLVSRDVLQANIDIQIFNIEEILNDDKNN